MDKFYALRRQINDQFQAPRTDDGASLVPASRPRENIFLFIPNLIGYARVILTIMSLYFMPLHPRRCTFLYVISCLLDALDGYSARRFKQGTRFCAVLDMVTDRCTTTCLLVFLATARPRWAMIFQLLISLDLASHYMHMYATLAMGSGQSHKQVDASRSKLLHLYYSNKIVLFTLCAMNELFFLALYLLAFEDPGPSGLPTETAEVKLQHDPWSPSAMEMARANKIGGNVPMILACICFLPMLLKQYINVCQLVTASQWLAEGDLAERAKQDELRSR